MTKALCVVAVLALAGCVTNQTAVWVPMPGHDFSGFEVSKAECSIMSRNSDRPYEAAGSATFVAAASLGNAIGNDIRRQQNFTDCMTIHGFQQRMVPEQQQAAQ